MRVFSNEDIETIRNSDLFDSQWYVAQYPDVQALDIDPAEHYLWIGARLGRNPSPTFDAAAYIKANRDLESYKLNPLLHFIRQGQKVDQNVVSAVPERMPRKPDIVLRVPNRQQMDGRRILTQSRNRQHFWYDNFFLEECLDNAHLITPLPADIRRLLVIAHDFKLLTGCTRSLSHFLNAMAAFGGVELTSIELGPSAHATVAANHVDTHDFVIVNSIAPFFDHDGMIDLVRKCGPQKSAVYLHETEWVFDKLKSAQPERFQQFATALREFNVLCVSRMQQKWLRNEFGVTKSVVVHEVTSLERPPPAAQRAGTAALRIVMAGTVQPRKGPTLFSKVADMAAAEGLPWTFHWAGHKHDLNVYMSNRVEWLGNLDSGDMFKFVTGADIFFLSSQDDPFPLCVLEALQARKRVAVYRKTGVSELFNQIDGPPGVVFDEYTPEAALAALRRVAAVRCSDEKFDSVNSKLSLTSFVSRMNESISTFANPVKAVSVPSKSDFITPKIAAIVHLYYHDLWWEIRSYLKNLEFLNCDLYITLSQDNSPSAIKSIKDEIRKTYSQAFILECPNRGMDIGPFVEVMNYIAAEGRNYDYLIKIHSKKSIEASGDEAGAKWRRELLEGLLGYRGKVDRVLNLFETDERVGMIGPRGMLLEKSSKDQAANANLNQNKMQELGQRLKIRDRTLQYFRGSMFWCRFQPIASALLDAKLSINDFEPGYATDASYAHAMERLFACIIRSNGQTLYELDETMPRTIRPLKDRHRGEDIYVIAAGASCDYIDTTFFKGKHVIGVNKAYKRFRCSYIVMKEYLGHDNEREMLQSGAIPIIAKWYSGNIREGQRQLNTLFIRDNSYYYFDHLENKREKVDLSVIGDHGDRINDKLVVSYSTITTAMHLAAYMGARNIILVGHDCGLLNRKATFDGYYGDMKTDSPWQNKGDYEAWLNQIEAQTLAVREKLKEVYGCNVVSLNPFVNFGLEGNIYERG